MFRKLFINFFERKCNIGIENSTASLYDPTLDELPTEVPKIDG